MRSVRSANCAVVIARDRLRADKHTALLLVGDRPFEPLAAYFRERNKSLSVEKLTARAVALLIDFIVARDADFAEKSRRHELLNEFAHSLHQGSFSGADDPTSLWWVARSSENTKDLLEAVCSFSDWLIENRGTQPLNPYRAASHAERIQYWRRWNKFKYTSLLAHTHHKSHNEGISVRMFATPSSPLTTEGRPPYFPHERFADLLIRGFRRRGTHASFWKQYCVRDMMVALLLHGGGLRPSEPFHIWVNDIQADPHEPGRALVRVFHPEEGSISFPDAETGNIVTSSRKAFLQLQGLRPLNHQTVYNGWKGNLLQKHGKFMPVFWYPENYGRLFLKLFKIYINYVRPMSLGHPWLFVTEDRLPMTAKAYSTLHDAAVHRIGLTASKPAGTTPHGHRHAYGQRMQELLEAGHIDKKIFQVVMHHRSALSQEAYNGKEWGRVNDELRKLSISDDDAFSNLVGEIPL
jgi:hypothetical protein